MFMGPQGTRCCLHMQACHLYPLQQSQGYCSVLPPCTFCNYSLKKAYHYKLSHGGFSVIHSNASQKLVLFFVWSLANKVAVIIISLYFGDRAVSLRNTAPLAYVIVQINVEALHLLNKVTVNIVITNIIIP